MGRAAIALLLQGLACGALAEVDDAACGLRYESRIEEFLLHSWARTSAAEWDSDEGAERHLESAERQLRACRGVGGSYWEVMMDTPEYLKHVRVSGDAADPWWPVAQAILARLHELPDLVLVGFCAPAACSEAQVRTAVFPLGLARHFSMDNFLPVPEPKEFRARELSHWSELRLDFVVAGVNRCGTTSLHRNLAQSADIEFTTEWEDGFFYRENRVLPYRREVEDFNRVWALRGREPRRLRGLSDSGLFRSVRARHALARIPGLRAVVAVCDPLSRVEKLFWWNDACAENGEPRNQNITFRGRCWPGLEASLREPRLLTRWDVRHRLRSLRRLLGPRLRLVHQASLRAAPLETYGDIAAFLGAGPFPLRTEFPRYNSVRGHRTGLCRNASLVRELQRRLAPEYEALEALLLDSGRAVPEELRLRRTRCDRPEDLIPELP